MPENQVENHIVDFRVPNFEWKGYYCPVDKKEHKDENSFLMNYHCIVCDTMLYNEKGNVVGGL